MIRILLIRHGSTDLLGRVLYGRMPGVNLNQEGMGQAEAIARALTRHYQLDAIISSPLERALETAKPLAAAQGRAIVIDEGITEIDFGGWVGKSFDELNELSRWRDFNRQRSIRWPPDGESMMEVQARAWRAIERAIEEYEPGATIAMVTHGDVVRCLLVLALGMAIDHIHRIEIAPGSVSEMQVGEHDPLVRRVNQNFL